MPEANLALISVPGAFAAVEARAALSAGLNVILFSDNVSLADEIALKRQATARGLLLMGPDCGTAYVADVPLGFANAVPPGRGVSWPPPAPGCSRWPRCWPGAGAASPTPSAWAGAT